MALNPIIGALNQRGLTGNLSRIKQTMASLRNIGNPQAMLMTAAGNNPELKRALEESGGDYQKAFYKYAEKMGVNPEEILGILKDYGVR